MFQYTQYIKSEICNRKVYYKPRSTMNDRIGFDYIVNMNIIDKVLVLEKSLRFKKCVYCNSKKCDVKLSCCGKKCHYNCAISNNFSCNCENKNTTNSKIVLTHDISIEKEDDTKCVVCMDEWETVTKCGHRICRSCLDTIYKEHGNNMMCPICRKRLIERKKPKKAEIEIDIENGDSVKVLIIFES